MTELTTKRLRLVPLGDEELEARVGAEADEHMRAALGEMLAGCKAEPKQRLWYTEWKICLRESGEEVGSLGFKGPPDKYGEVELGYGILEAHRRLGYATEAVAAALNHAFSSREVYFVTAETEADNAASLRILKNAGFTPAGDGEEGPRFEKARRYIPFAPLYLCVGLLFGMLFGVVFDALPLCMFIGMAIGAGLGAALDVASRKTLADLKLKRNSKV
ncbi:MAG: GNAT family N-acetyltransferase [Oscillospiraceae bacterium]